MVTGFCLGAQAAGAESRMRVAVLPVEGVNLAPGDVARFRSLVRQSLGKHAAVSSSEEAAVLPPWCALEASCLGALGRRLGVSKLLALRVGRLSDTLALRLTVFDVARGVRQGTWEEVLRRADDRGIAEALDRMLVGVFPPPPPRRPWYAQWWVWTVAGVVVAGATTATILATRGGDEPRRVITPP
jgi:hypothetical protein